MSTSGEFPFTRGNTQLAVAKEDSHGTEQTDATAFETLGKIVDAGDMPDPEVDWLEEYLIDGSGRQLSGKEPGQNTYDGGSLTVLPVDAYPFEFLFGNDLNGSNEVRVSSQPLPQTLTVEATQYGAGTDDDFVRTFVGNAPDAGTIEVDNESRLSLELDFLAQGVKTGTSPTADVSEPAASPFLFHDADSFLSIHGTDYARVTDFSWELSNNLDPRYYIQPNNPEDPYEVHYGNAGHTIEATVVPVDDGLYQEVLGRDDAGNASISFTRPDGASLSFNFGNVGVQSSPYPLPDEGAAETTVSLIPDTGYISYTA